MATEIAHNSLVELGLTSLESMAYAFLVENSPATGYRVAKALGKPTANTYKALDSLCDKGAVLVEGGVSRRYRAVPINELLESLGTRFARLRAEAAAELSKLKPADEDERIYQLQTVEQVYQRATQMLRRCSSVALLDLFPLPLAELKNELRETAARGVSVFAKIYQTAEMEGVQLVMADNAQLTLERWPGCWLNLVTDAREHLLCFLSRDARSVHQAVWSSSTYLSFLYHSSLYFELRHAALVQSMREARQTVNPTPLITELAAPKVIEAPGFIDLQQQFSDTAPNAVAKQTR